MNEKPRILLTDTFLTSAHMGLLRALLDLAVKEGLDVVYEKDNATFEVKKNDFPDSIIRIYAIPDDTAERVARRKQWRTNMARHDYRG